MTWTRSADDRLRGCIGSLEARPLSSGLPDFALTSALRDRRFAPVAAKELPALECTVSLLSRYEKAAAWDDWVVGTHGVLLSFACPATGQRRSATYLPEIAAREGWSKRVAVESLVRKAGHSGAVSDRLLASCAVTRYQSSKLTRTHAEWLASLPN